ALGVGWKAAAGSLITPGRKINEVPVPSNSAQVPAPVAYLARSLERKREKIDAALALVTGLRLDALADRGEPVSGETFTVRVDPHHRGEIAGDFKKTTLRLPSEWNDTKEAKENSGATRHHMSTRPNTQRTPPPAAT